MTAVRPNVLLIETRNTREWVGVCVRMYGTMQPFRRDCRLPWTDHSYSLAGWVAGGEYAVS